MRDAGSGFTIRTHAISAHGQLAFSISNRHHHGQSQDAATNVSPKNRTDTWHTAIFLTDIPPRRKPRNARSKRALEKRAPKEKENPKTCLFLRGTTCSQVTQDALADLYSLRQPLAKKFTKKNAVHPFEDATSLEFFSEKNDASLLVFGSSSKKRPHCLTLVRTFGHRVLDMLELGLDPESFRRLAQFRGKKPAVGLRPMLVFAGPAFESTVPDEFTMAKSMLTDFFAGERGPGSDKIDVEGLQYVVVISADEAEANTTATGLGDGSVSKPTIHLRSYLIQTKRSGQRLPRVEVGLVQ